MSSLLLRFFRPFESPVVSVVKMDRWIYNRLKTIKAENMLTSKTEQELDKIQYDLVLSEARCKMEDLWQIIPAPMRWPLSFIHLVFSL